MSEHMPDDEYTIEITVRNGRRSWMQSTMLTFRQEGHRSDFEGYVMETFNHLKAEGQKDERDWIRMRSS